jgi:hypothetical protein
VTVHGTKKCPISDDHHRLNIVAQTAALRYSVTLVLPDGSVVNADYREHFESRQAIRFTEWKVEGFTDSETELARAIIEAPDSSMFDDDVRRYFESNLAATDAPLPPLHWGDRMWHHWETPPG